MVENVCQWKMVHFSASAMEATQVRFCDLIGLTEQAHEVFLSLYQRC